LSASIPLLLSLYGSVLAEHSSLYCSAPITSGRRYIEWLRSSSLRVDSVEHATTTFKEAHRLSVISPNIEHAQHTIKALRSSTGLPVIDPTHIPAQNGWTQADWLTLWIAVIDRFALAVVLLDDWQFSFGCAHEFLHAHRTGIPTFDERGNAVEREHGMALISAAVDDIASIHGNSQPLRSSLQELATISVKTMPSESLSRFLSRHSIDAL
jgi:hypothetical protein